MVNPHFSPGRWMDYEPFAKFARKRDLLSGRVVIPGSAGVPPAQDLAGSWRLASQGWSVHLPTGAGAAPLQECGRDARAPRGKPMAGQVQIRILQKALMKECLSSVRYWSFFEGMRVQTALGVLWLVFFPPARTCSLAGSSGYALRSRARAEGKNPAPLSRPPVRNAG